MGLFSKTMAHVLLFYSLIKALWIISFWIWFICNYLIAEKLGEKNWQFKAY